MFEEVPRDRRGLARLTARHVVLGPFVVGGGVLLAAVGGSAAVAATVITASSIRASDVPPRPAPTPVVATSSHRAAAHRAPAPASSSRAGVAGTTVAAGVPVGAAPSAGGSAISRPTAAPRSSDVRTAPPTLGKPDVDPYRSGRPSPSPSGSPAGNALLYVTGYDQASQRLQFEYAVVSPGAGPGGSDLYQVESARRYSATLATDLTVTSGGQLCPPAGSRCSLDQLIAGAGAGFYAIAAIDPEDQLHSVIEVDNAGSGAGYAPAATATATPTGSPSPSPTSS